VSDRAPPSDPAARIHELLSRPNSQRRLEYKYRTAQAIVFGLPVLALHIVGPRLGGPDAPRWTGLLQAILTGWIIYVGAAGMLLEGMITAARSSLADMLVAFVAIAVYIYSAALVIIMIFTGRTLQLHPFFHICVLLVVAWCGWRWWRFRSA
jgi:cation transport ATPase